MGESKIDKDPGIVGLMVPGAVIAACFGMEGRPTYANAIPATRLGELLTVYESRHGITPMSKRDIEMHVHHHKLLLKLILEGGPRQSDDWVPAAASNMLWSGFNHPGLGLGLRRKGAAMLRDKGRATMLFEIRDGALMFTLTDAPVPTAAKPANDHADPA